MVILPINFGRCTYFVKGKLWEQQIDHYFSNGIFSCCNLLGAKINVFMLKYCAFSKVKKKGASTEIYRYNVKNKDTGSLSGMCQVNLKNTWMKLLEVAIVSFSSHWTSFSCIFSNGNLGPVEFSRIAVFKHSLSVVTLIVLSSINIKFHYFSVNN